MGLNDIRLTAHTLAELYPASLIAEDKSSAMSEAGEPTAESLLSKPAGRLKGEEPAVRLAGDSSSGEPLVRESPASLMAGTWKFLGNNAQKILVLVQYEGNAYLPDEELEFLTRMLVACKLSLNDVAIVNRSHYPGRASSDYLAFFKSRTVFLFGIEPAEFGLPLAFPFYQIQAFAGTTFLYTPPLEERLTDGLYKSRLWVSLKQIFSL